MRDAIQFKKMEEKKIKLCSRTEKKKKKKKKKKKESACLRYLKQTVSLIVMWILRLSFLLVFKSTFFFKLSICMTLSLKDPWLSVLFQLTELFRLILENS